MGVEELLDTVVDTETSRFSAAFDTTLSSKLTSAAAFSINVAFTVHVHIGILDPGHDLLISAKIRSETIDLWSNETLLREFHSISPRDSLDLTLRVLRGVDLYTTLSTTEGYISNSEFESHERGKSHNFLDIHRWRIAGTAFNGEFVVLVLGTVAEDLLHLAVVTSDWDCETDNVVTDLDHFEVVFGNVGFGCCAVEEEFDLFEETGFFGGVCNWASLFSKGAHTYITDKQRCLRVVIGVDLPRTLMDPYWR